VAAAWHALTGERIPAIDLSRSKLGLPSSYFFDGLAPAMADCVQSGLRALENAGVELVPIDVPALRETDSLYTDIARPEVLATLGSDSFEAMRQRLNPDVAHRISAGLGVSAERYLTAQRRRSSLSEVVNATFENLDGWIAPAKQHFPPVYPGDFPSAAMERAMEAHCYGPTRPANLFDLCGCSLPLGRQSERLPAALQLLGPSGCEAQVLGLAMACEAVLGVSNLPDMTDWIP
jgi:aspartyl-tRNA(Asn)/glutamyl-tRNA(Gln) amidotransferase subunit A